MSLWADTGDPGGPFGSSRKGHGSLEAACRVKDWTRERFGLSEEETIVVAQIAPSLPGFPPLQTAVAFWTAGNKRHHFTIFKAVENIDEADMPPAWLKDSLALAEGVECACC